MVSSRSENYDRMQKQPELRRAFSGEEAVTLKRPRQNDF
jgi:hypothetical protein